jgi:hypothetical protein
MIHPKRGAATSRPTGDQRSFSAAFWASKVPTTTGAALRSGHHSLKGWTTFLRMTGQDSMRFCPRT